MLRLQHANKICSSLCLRVVQHSHQYVHRISCARHLSSCSTDAVSKRRVVVTGLGMTSPLAVGVQESWSRLLAGKSGLVSLRDRSEFEKVPSQVAAFVPSDELRNRLQTLEKEDIRNSSNSTIHALLCSDEALADAGNYRPENTSAERRTGVVIGCGLVEIEQMHDFTQLFRERGYNRLSPFFVTKILINMPAGQVSIRHKLRGPNLALSTACTTGCHAIGEAFDLIRNGRADRMLAGGVDTVLTPMAMLAFCRARALCVKFNDEPEQASRPFDEQRAGFVMGEGCGIVFLEELEHAKARGAKIYAEILGYGMSGDAHHITSPHPEGQGAYDSMIEAVQDAGLSPGAIEHVNCHATSTPMGDTLELKAIRQLFRPELIDRVQITSTKGAIGHLLGGAGSVEAIFTILACSQGLIPPTLNLHKPELPDFNYVRKPHHRWVQASTNSRRIALTNSFGFGGTNASLVIAQYMPN